MVRSIPDNKRRILAWAVRARMRKGATRTEAVRSAAEEFEVTERSVWTALRWFRQYQMREGFPPSLRLD